MSPNKMASLAMLILSAGTSSVALADDTSKDVRPSHLLTVETGSTLAEKSMVFSLFGGGGRTAYGVTKEFEARLDYSWTTVMNSGTSVTAYSVGPTAKYNFYSNGGFSTSLAGTASNTQVSNVSFTTVAGRLPLSYSAGFGLLTAVPTIIKASNSDAQVGAEFAAIFPLGSLAALVGEFKFFSQNSKTTTNYNAGIVFTPAKRITIPLVLAKYDGTVTQVGITALFAHIGFEF